MDKQRLLEELRGKISDGEMTQEEVIAWLRMNQESDHLRIQNQGDTKHHFSVTKMLYLLGAGIVLVGLFIFMAQIWDDMNSFSRILITLGLGALFAVLGSRLFEQASESKLGIVFHGIGGMMVPLGALVAIEELGLQGDWTLALTFNLIFALYLFLTFIHKQVVLTFFAVANGTMAVYLSVMAAFEPVLGYRELEVIVEYLTIVIGGGYLLLARHFVGGWNNKLVGVLSFFGSTGLLGAAFLQVLDVSLWELLYFVLVFGCLVLSVYLRSRVVLVVSTLFLLVHVSYITSEYFADSLGWPIMLVVLGFVFIGLGYASLAINNKYIKQSHLMS